MDDLKGKTVRGGLIRVFGQLAGLVIRLASLVVLARLLEPGDFGLMTMIVIVTTFFGLFATAGLTAATVQKEQLSNEQISTLFWINIVIGSAPTLLCLTAAPHLAAFYNDHRVKWIAIAVAPIFLITAMGAQHSALLQRQLRYFALTVVDIGAQLGGFVLAIALALGGAGYWALVVAAIATPTITTIGVWLATRWVPSPPQRGAEIASLVRFGGVMTLNWVVIYIAYNFEKVLLGRFWGADALGIYGRAYQLINLPSESLNAAVSGVAFSALSRLQSDPARFKRYFLGGYSLIQAVTIPITLLCVLLADEIIFVALGRKWADAAIVFRLLAPTILVFGVINPTAPLLQSAGLQVRSLKIALVIAPLVIGAYVVGLPFGPSGVALAYSAVMILWVVPHVIWCLKGTVVTPMELVRAAARPFVASALSAGVTVVVLLCCDPFGTAIARLALGTSVMLTSYVIILLFVMKQRDFYMNLLAGLMPSSAVSTETQAVGISQVMAPQPPASGSQIGAS